MNIAITQDTRERDRYENKLRVRMEYGGTLGFGELERMLVLDSTYTSLGPLLSLLQSLQIIEDSALKISRWVRVFSRFFASHFRLLRFFEFVGSSKSSNAPSPRRFPIPH